MQSNQYVPMLLSLIFSIVTISVYPVSAQDDAATPAPCSQPQASQFDFWLGEWELSWSGGQAGTPEGETGKAENHIRKILGTCVVEENFRTADGTFIGRSWSVYSSPTKEWRQTWVDNQGSYLLFTGTYSGDRMELRTRPNERNGKTFISRMVFKNITENSLNWDWQRSDDGGKTWTDLWNIRYVRKTSKTHG